MSAEKPGIQIFTLFLQSAFLMKDHQVEIALPGISAIRISG
ncbi:hypothetical protein [Methanoregula sp.]